MKRTRFFALILSLLLFLPALTACTNTAETAPPPARGLRLAYHGETAYRVVVSKDASQDVRTMAEEFVSYFESITGAKLEITDDTADTACSPYTVGGITYEAIPEIIIGSADRPLCRGNEANRLEEEEFLLCTDEENLLLTGGSDRAVAYAVYAFLEERMGVRYLSADYEYVPTTDNLEVAKGMYRTSKPSFEFRTLSGGGMDSKWHVKMRLNSRQSLGSENYRQELFVGGGLGYADWFVHTITKLAELPEKDENGNYNTAQPCLTDETVYQTVLKNVRKWLEEYPDATIVSISQNDGGDESSMCCCENCTAIYEAHGKVQSAKWVRFVSRIANELRDEYPDVYFDTLAYSFTLLAPTDISVPDNVIIRIAPIGSCYEHGTDCADSGAPTRAQRISDRLKSALAGWQKIAKHLYVWDYSALFANYWTPLTNFEAQRRNMQNYSRFSVTGMYMQGAEESPFAPLSAYLSAKLMWDAEMSEEEYREHIAEFCRLYYGAEEAMLDYIDLISAESTKSHYSTHAVLGRDLLCFETTENKESSLLEQMKACFERAEQGDLSEEQAEHLKKAKLQVQYYEVVYLFWLEENDPDAVIDYEKREALNRALYEDAVACGCTQISERVKIPANPNFQNAPLNWGKTNLQNDEQY